MTDSIKWRAGYSILISIAFGLALAGAAGWYYVRSREAFEASATSELEAIAGFKVRQIASWRAERLGDGAILGSAPIIEIARRVILSKSVSAADRGSLQDVLHRLVMTFDYAGATVVDLEGNPRLQLKTNHSDPARFKQLTAAAILAGNAVLSDLYKESGSNRPWMSLTVPVPEAGSIILDIDPGTFLYPYLESWPKASRSAETTLVRREGAGILYLSNLRQHPGSALQYSRSFAGRDLLQNPPFVRGRPSAWKDYRGIPVLGVIRAIPHSGWFLTAKVDVEEVDAPVKRLGWVLTLLVALIALANAAVAGLIWRGRQLRIYRHREATFRQIANDTPAYLWTIAAGGRISFVNRQCARFLGRDQNHLEEGWGPCLHPGDRDRLIAAFDEHFRLRLEYNDEFRIRRFDGDYRWVLVHARPKFLENGKFDGYSGSFVDVTERREAEQQLRAANAALALELDERTRSEREVHALTARLINAQEEERTRLARELHDDLSQQIAVLSLGTSNLKKRIPPDAAEAISRLEQIRQKLVSLAEWVRRLSHQLHPSALEHSGLEAALRGYCQELAALTSRRVTFRSEYSCDPVSAPVALCVYRVAQEALQNSIKHSRTEEAEVELTCEGGLLRLTVSDSGVGMAPDATSRGGLGLVSMKERTRLVNGTFQLRSRPAEGTTITLTVPV